jgi:hypothetical protein
VTTVDLKLDRTDRRLYAALWTVIVVYACLVPYAAKKDGDFVPLWVGGRVVAHGMADKLYDPSTHYAILADTGIDARAFHNPRHDRLGMFWYPPPAALFYAPFGMLPLTMAEAAQAVLNLFLDLYVAYALYRLVRGRLRFGAIGLLVLLSPAGFYSFALGQNGILTAAIAVTAWTFLERGEQGKAGAMLGLLVYKPNWLLSLVWAPFAERRWSAVVAALVSTFAVVLSTLLLLGAPTFVAYAGKAQPLTVLNRLPGYPLEVLYSTLSLFRRYFGLTRVGDTAGWVAVLLGLLAAIWLIGPKRGARGPLPLHATGLSWMTAVWVNPHVNHYDMVLVCCALVVALADWSSLSVGARVALAGIAVFHYLSFPITSALGLNLTLPLPIFSTLLIWCWFAAACWLDRRPGPSLAKNACRARGE